MATVFKIRRSDGLFSMGGSTPDFNKTGKMWTHKGHISRHLGQLDNRRHHRPLKGGSGLSKVYDDCEIVSYELVENPAVSGETIEDYLTDIIQRKEEREAAYAKRRKEYQTEERRKQFENLKREFEP